MQLKHTIKLPKALYTKCHQIENILQEGIIQYDILILTSAKYYKHYVTL